jgi:hypothetical protein
MVAMDKPVVVAWFVDEPIESWDELAEVKLRARQLCDPHYQAAQSASRLDQAAALFGMDGVDPEQTWDAAKAHGLTDADLDAAAHVAVTLRKLELDLE